MKSDIHPQVYDVVFVDASSGAQFITQSTRKSDETVTINGKEYYVIKVEITSDTHPFYTGKQKLLDTAGRVDKFNARRKKAEAIKGKNEKGEPADAATEKKQEDVAAAVEAGAKAEKEEAPAEE